MKRAFFFSTFILIVYIGFAQDFIDEAASLLNNPLPPGFKRLDKGENFGIFVNNNFYGGYLVVLTREDDNVIISTINVVFEKKDSDIIKYIVRINISKWLLGLLTITLSY